jgi:hypothetical protein
MIISSVCHCEIDYDGPNEFDDGCVEMTFNHGFIINKSTIEILKNMVSTSSSIHVDGSASENIIIVTFFI